MTVSVESRVILPVGTRIVTRSDIPARDSTALRPAGAVAVIVKSPGDPTHAYRVRFPDGHEATLSRHEFDIFAHVQSGPLRQGAEHEADSHAVDLNACVIYRCITGSRAYGLDQDHSDIDRRGIYLPPADLHWSLYGVPEQLERHETQECYWEIQKFLTLALKANPNVLECLYTPLVEYASPLAIELLDMRDAFLSRLVYQTYNAYVLSQFRKMEQDLRTRGQVRWKHAMHLMRLQLSGLTVLREGLVPVRVDEHRERLLAIRRGELPFEDVNRWRLELHQAFDEAYQTTALPQQPDYTRVNTFLIKCRRFAAESMPAAAASVPAEPRVVVPAREPSPTLQSTALPPLLSDIVGEQPYPLLFATISGAHLYGFASPDSDYDLRGVHILPRDEVLGLKVVRETIECSADREGLELDLVTHDAAKFFKLLLKKNGYVLEQLYSPLIVHSGPQHDELKQIARGCITRHHAHHYLGFAATQWKLFQKEHPPRVKPLLYVYRVLLTGIHLMRTGQVEANLPRLNEQFQLSYVEDLIARKAVGPERATLSDADVTFHQAEYGRLVTELECASRNSHLPSVATCLDALSELLVRIRK